MYPRRLTRDKTTSCAKRHAPIETVPSTVRIVFILPRGYRTEMDPLVETLADRYMRTHARSRAYLCITSNYTYVIISMSL